MLYRVVLPGPTLHDRRRGARAYVPPGIKVPKRDHCEQRYVVITLWYGPRADGGGLLAYEVAVAVCYARGGGKHAANFGAFQAGDT